MRLPVIPTVLVAAAVSVMVSLGIWQLHRSDEKEAVRARIARNAALPPMALPAMRSVDEKLLFRRVSAECLEVTRWRKAGGHSASGQGGTRFLAECRTGADGPGFVADMGVSADPRAVPNWRGGRVTGRLVAEPVQAGLWARLTRRAPPPRPMIVSFRSAPPLQASEQPALDSVINNSFGYAFQWFFFALVAIAIYAVALRRRAGRAEAPPAG